MKENQEKVSTWKTLFANSYCKKTQELTHELGTTIATFSEINVTCDWERFSEIAEIGRVVERVCENTMQMLSVLGAVNQDQREK